MATFRSGDEPVAGYKLIEFLGRGSYGEVWKASGPGRVEVALKFISLDNKQGLKEFKSVGLVKKLRHPNLVPIHAIWLKDSNGNVLGDGGGESISINLMGNKDLVIAMGLGDKSLAQRLEENKNLGIPPRELIRYMEEAAKGLDYLNEPVHEPANARIIHCDVKPGNLLIVGGGVQVCDYGVARALSTDMRKTYGAGTPAYAAPELINNDPSPQTDQYSLAITYIEMRTGQLPFDETKALVSNLTGRLDLTRLEKGEQEVIRKATSMQPGKRFETSLDMIEELKAVLGSSLGGRTGAISSAATQRPMPAAPPPSTPEVAPAKSNRTINDLLQKGAELVPDHTLVRLLGQGGYGQVWEANGPGDVPCALKIVRDQQGKGKQEFDILNKIRKLKHPYLIQLRGYWLLAKDGSRVAVDQLGHPGVPQPAAVVISTDLAEKNLFQRMLECQEQGLSGLAPAELMDYMRQAAAAIDYLNANHIQHRDIKPENILLSGNQAFVSDFGLAKLVEGEGSTVTSSSSGMTLDYAAPELLQKRVTLWTDQYSLALTYVSLRTGRTPFPPHASVHEKIQARINGQLDLSAVSPPEKEVLLVALHREPDRRFENCSAMVAKLAGALGLGSGPLIPPEGTIGSGPYPPLPQRDSGNFGRQSGPMAMPVRSVATIESAPVPLLVAQASPSGSVKGTMQFGDTAPMTAPAPPSNPWKTETSRASSTTQKDTGVWKETTEETKKSGVPAVAWIVGFILMAAGGVGAYIALGGSGIGVASSSGSGEVAKSEGSNGGASSGSAKSVASAATPIVTSHVTKVEPTPPDREKFIKDLAAIQQQLNEGKIEAGRIAIEAFLKTPDLPADLAKTAATLKAGWALLAGDPGDVAALLKNVDDYRVNLASFDADRKIYYESAYKKKLADWIAKLTANLDAKTPWDKLGEACTLAEPTPMVAAVSEECALEIKLAGGTPQFTVVTAAGKPPAEVSGYIASIRTALEGRIAEAAKSAAELIPGGKVPEWLQNPRRAERLIAVFDDASQSLRKTGRENLATPFTKEDAKRVIGWLAAAQSLPPDAAKPRAASLRLNLLLARWVSNSADKSLGSLADELAEETTFKSLKLDKPGEARFWAIVAASRGETAKGRKEAIEAYRKVLKCADEDREGIAKSFVVETVLKPLMAQPFVQGLAKVDHAVKLEAVKLLAELAHDLRRSADEWKGVRGLEEKPLVAAVKLYDRAVELLKRPQDHAWRGIMKSELNDAKLADFEEDARVAESADPNEPAVKALRGIAAGFKARDRKDIADRIADYHDAEILFRDAIATCEAERKASGDAGDLRRDDLVLLYKHAADNLILLANGDQSNLNRQHSELARALQWAEKLIPLQGRNWDGYDAQGCALEELAWLLHPVNRTETGGTYAEAVKAYDNACGKTGQRPLAHLHRGRCLYKWAFEKFQLHQGFDDATVKRADDDLEVALKTAEPDAAGIRAESLYWRARCKMLRYENGDGDAKANYEAAVKDFAAALDLAGKPSAVVWFEPCASELASAHIHVARRLAAGGDKAAAEKLLPRIDAAIQITRPQPLPAMWQAKLAVDKLGVQTAISGNPSTLAELDTIVTAAVKEECLSQHRGLQVMMLIARSDAFNTSQQSKGKPDRDAAFKDATAACQLAEKNAAVDHETRALAFSLRATLQYTIAFGTDGTLDLSALGDARIDVARACAFAPDNPNAYIWHYLAWVIGIRDYSKAKKANEPAPAVANLLAAALQHEREFWRLVPKVNPYRGRMEVYKNEYSQFETTLADTIKANPDAAPADLLSWRLSLDEHLFLTDKADGAVKKATENDLAAAIRDLPDITDSVARRSRELQIARLTKLLKP